MKPDPLNPKIVNGSFEEATEGEDKPRGWHYQRQVQLTSGDDAPDGSQFITFTNQEPGRGSRALQAFAIDGRRIREIEVSVWVRGDSVRPGQSAADLPALAITFYDETRRSRDMRVMGGWRGTFGWQQVSTRVEIPPEAREAILRIGLLGAVGEASFDGVELKVLKRQKER